MATKKLTRNTDDKMLAGVASGLSDYLNIDTTIIRVGFVLTSIFYGFGFWTYLIMWVLVPDKEGDVIIDISKKDDKK